MNSRFAMVAAYVALNISAQAIAQPVYRTPTCLLSPADQAWADRAVAAWRHARDKIVTIRPASRSKIVFFGSNCMIVSTNALFGNGKPVWGSLPITDRVPLSAADWRPISVTAEATVIEGQSLFVMAAPSIWSAAKVPGGASFDLETLMIAVMLHEASHVSHGDTYMAEFTGVAKRHSLPEDFNDDSLQKLYDKDVEFSNSVAKETDLLFAAAMASNDQEAERLARQARQLIFARRAKYYTGKNTINSRIEDLFLTLEGAGQWVGYSWLIDGEGGGVSKADAIAQFGRRSRWWSQNQGLALALATDRLDSGAWRRTAFGNGKSAGVALLDQALSAAKLNRKDS